MTQQSQRKIYSVTEITNIIKQTLETQIQELWLTGEISNYKTYSSGHSFFSLKDENSQINAIMWNQQVKLIRFRPEDGLKVIVFGRISVYAKRGEYRIIVDYIEPAGKGALQLAFEQLKQKLSSEGLFDESKKKPIPLLLKKVGIVTSEDGAALHDILTILQQEDLEILIYPARVQGDEAKYDISQAIEYLNEHYKDLDVLLVGRGGGSLEDLWPFNEEIVARAIFSSKIPVISCVGHEVDYTISDFVSDMRAPTPTAAAEFVARRRRELREGLQDMVKRLRNHLNYISSNLTQRMNNILNSRVFTRPFSLIEEKLQEVDDVFLQIINSVKHLAEMKSYDLKILDEKLKALSPLNILSRGYSIVWKLPENVIIKDAEDLSIKDKLKIRLHKGEVLSEVKETKKYEKRD
ncbi:MAG: exodeoxyribonuclease VII large subunit [Elusimicrobia bacterium CG1_02_37_114]|nr:MAG: exodeoxyribonuclease VII large subunit [Elusimicrobia bacterium CG1_02_37_114]PIV54056.1 MAG: exodeoxyribonuclease VII large subunit [Elusimicrobia bacterium CG02_land_8_20_14_3_00_37_13]PIZ12620.1 MAG: exodeoxyribonuclease VII large subunit [Elusimicrobia bacterium CG_4_10_14_0_8_um_filter_37_32]